VNVAVYPGSFDPVTYGHLDVIARAAPVFDRLVVAVLANPRKTPLLSAGERVRLIDAALDDGLSGDLRPRLEVEAFDGLTVDFCRARQARWVVRGLRAISDFELEMQLAHTNRVLAPEVDAVFFMTALEHGYVSSSLAREIASFGGDVSALVPPAAVAALVDAIRAADPVR
jgi:pantetheine-phosphate adenylyltransferase